VWVGSCPWLVKSLLTELVPVLGETTSKSAFVPAIFRLVSITESHAVHSIWKWLTYPNYSWHIYLVCSLRSSVTFFPQETYPSVSLYYFVIVLPTMDKTNRLLLSLKGCSNTDLSLKVVFSNPIIPTTFWISKPIYIIS